MVNSFFDAMWLVLDLRPKGRIYCSRISTRKRASPLDAGR